MSGALLVLLPMVTLAAPQTTTRESVDAGGAEGNSFSFVPTLSAGGDVIAFSSLASNLVAGDTNGRFDVFVRDRSTGAVTRVSVSSAGVQGNSDSYVSAISADGQVVAFQSDATNLVGGDTNSAMDIFVRELATAKTRRVSISTSGAEADGGCTSPSISADGQLVAFASSANSLVANDSNQTSDIFVRDRTAGTTTRVSVSSAGVEADGGSYAPWISADGRYVTFGSSASNLVAGDTNQATDVFVHDRLLATTTRVSVSSSGGEAGAGTYLDATISADGSRVAFYSPSNDLVPGDTNFQTDVFVRDLVAGTTTRASLSSGGGQADFACAYPFISGNGRFVTFVSYSTGLVAPDNNGQPDAFRHDLATGTTIRVNLDSAGVEANGAIDIDHIVALNDDGEVAAFGSDATNHVAGDANGTRDVFVHERCGTEASRANYGAGWPGTLGVPSLTCDVDPEFGATITITTGNSLGSDTFMLLFVGFAPASIPSGWDGTLLVAPFFVFPLGLPAAGLPMSTTLPAHDHALCGFGIYLQALESDGGASDGVSFTPGLELVIGS